MPSLPRRLAGLGLLVLLFASFSSPHAVASRQTECLDPVVNGSFEQAGLDGWERGGSVAVDDLAHEGIWSAVLGGEHLSQDWIGQALELPVDPMTATLRYALFISTEETGGQAYDHLRVEARDAGDLLLADLGSWSNLQASEIWLSGQVDLREFPSLLGREFRLIFQATTDSSLSTSFYLDAVGLELCADGDTCGDPFEPNDDFETAVGLDPGADFEAWICDSEDLDFYSFDAEEGQRYLVLLDGGGGTELPADYELALYDPDRVYVMRSELPGGAPETLDFVAQRDGTWYLRVYGYQGAHDREQPYRLRYDPESPASPTPSPLAATPSPSSTSSPTPTAAVLTSTPTPTVDDPIGASATPSPQGGGPSPTPTPRYPTCPDAYEPNNATSESLWSILDAARLSYLCAADDVDLWKVEQVAISQTLEVRLLDLPADYRLELFRPGGSLAKSADHAGTATERIAFTADEAGDWLVRVTGVSGAHSASLPYTLVAGSYACALDHREGALGNDDRAHATGLDTPGAGHTEAALSICPARDEDWFSVPLLAGRPFTAELVHTRGQDHVKLCLIDRDGQTEITCTPGQSGSEQLSHSVTQDDAGTYYLRVVAADPARPVNAWYNLNLTAPGPTLTPNPGPTVSPTPTLDRPYPNCPDAYELNDDASQASAMPASGSVQAYLCTSRSVRQPDGSSRQIHDEDWWAVAVQPEAGNPGQALYAQIEKQDYQIEWYAPGGTRLMGSGRSSGGGLPRIATASGSRGTYFLRVRSSASAGPNEVEPYRLTVWDERCDDPYEPNDDFVEALSVALASGSRQTRQAYLCHEGDRDLFAIELQAGQRLDATLVGVGDSELRLYDPWRNRITRHGTGLIHQAQVSGRHFVEVVSRSGTRFSRRNAYELGLQLGSATSLPRRNLWLMDMEVNQRLQTADNDLPVYAEIPTMLRMYAGTSDVGRVTLQTPMRGFVSARLDGQELKPAQLSCSSLPRVGYTDVTTTYLRSRLDRSLNCILPSSWISRTGQLELTGHVYAPGVDESSASDNRRQVTVELQRGVPVMLRSVQVRSCGDPQNCGPSDGPAFSTYRNQQAWASRFFPTHEIAIEPPGNRSLIATGIRGTWNALLARFAARLSDRNGHVDVVFGASRSLDLFTGGFGGGFRFWSNVDAGKSRQLLAHELGHALGLSHVDACYAGGTFSSYPGAPRLDVAGHRSAFGLDLGVSPPEVKAPRDHHDFMSYCYDWISRHHYERLHANLKSFAAGPGFFMATEPKPPAQAAGPLTATDAEDPMQSEVEPDGEYLGIFGSIDLNSEEVWLVDPERMLGRELDPLHFVPGEGDFVLRAESLDGELLDERRFAPTSDPEGEGPASFSLLLPDRPEMARLVVSREGRELHRLERSPNPPTVSLDPLPAEAGEALVVGWRAEDADGDALRASLYLSLDEGQTWRVEQLAIPVEAGQLQRYRLETDRWPAADAARLRLRVSDGLNEAEVEGGPFRIAAKGPSARIDLPADGATLAPERPVLLAGQAWDPEEGPLSGRALTWRSDRQGTLGHGASLLLPELEPGWHRLELEARDAAGARDLVDLRVFVGWRGYAPFAGQAR